MEYGITNLYTVDNDKFSIKSNGTSARATTDGINAAIVWAKEQGFKGILLTAGTYLIQCNWSSPNVAPNDGILIPSDTILDLSFATLKIETNANPTYNLIYTKKGTNNIIINGGYLIGDKDLHDYSDTTYPTHEWGCGINIVASTNVIVQNMTIRDMTGDAITVRGSGNINSDKVNIHDNILCNCRRNGIAVTGGNSVMISNNIIYKIVGTSPECGIDIEPNSGYKAENCIITYNAISDCNLYSIMLASSCSNNIITRNKCVNGAIVIGGRVSNIGLFLNKLIDKGIGINAGATGINMNGNVFSGASVLDDKNL